MSSLTAMRVFNRVAELQSFSAAARDLGLSTSAVSRHVQELEDSLGVRLLNRTTRRISLTEVGESYLPRSRAIIESVDDLHDATRALHHAPSGTLRVSAVESFGWCCVVPVLSGFRRRFPAVNVVLDLSNRMADLVEEGIDVAVRMGKLGDSSLVARRIAVPRMVACAAPSYIERHGAPRAPEDLKDHACILFPESWRSGAVWRFERGGEETVIELPSAAVAINNSGAVRDVALDGEGIVYVPDFVVAGAIDAGRLVPVLTEWTGEARPVHAVFPHRRYLSAKTRVFVDYLVERLTPADGEGPVRC